MIFFEESDIAEVTSEITTANGTNFVLYSKSDFVGPLWDLLQAAFAQDLFTVAWSAYGDYIGRTHIIGTTYDEKKSPYFPDMNERYQEKLKRIEQENKELEEQLAENSTQADVPANATQAEANVTQTETNATAAETDSNKTNEEQTIFTEGVNTTADNVTETEKEEYELKVDENGEIDLGDKWPEILYHAFWAIPDSAETICFGDVNHQKKFERVGAGAVCLKSEAVVQKILDYCWAT